jgi:hypothetical protein
MKNGIIRSFFPAFVGLKEANNERTTRLAGVLAEFPNTYSGIQRR